MTMQFDNLKDVKARAILQVGYAMAETLLRADAAAAASVPEFIAKIMLCKRGFSAKEADEDADVRAIEQAMTRIIERVMGRRDLRGGGGATGGGRIIL